MFLVVSSLRDGGLKGRIGAIVKHRPACQRAPLPEVFLTISCFVSFSLRLVCYAG